jgi:hypothetical protein
MGLYPAEPFNVCSATLLALPAGPRETVFNLCQGPRMEVATRAGNFTHGFTESPKTVDGPIETRNAPPGVTAGRGFGVDFRRDISYIPISRATSAKMISAMGAGGVETSPLHIFSLQTFQECRQVRHLRAARNLYDPATPCRGSPCQNTPSFCIRRKLCPLFAKKHYQQHFQPHTGIYKSTLPFCVCWSLHA